MSLDDEMLFELLFAANYLDLVPLLDICAATVGLRMMSERQTQGGKGKGRVACVRNVPVRLHTYRGCLQNVQI
ncbi:unnamed protein product [Discosporangium mesarthrocarpum]